MNSLQKKVHFQCNICGNFVTCPIEQFGRETPSCSCCGSTVRMRSVIHLLSLEMFGEGIPLPKFPEDKRIAGIGMSDWPGYAIALEKKLSYQNTYYHKEPKLDITKIDHHLEHTYDFIISSDVFEHIKPPVSLAFENLFRLLKENGVIIFTVPYIPDGMDTLEHFPDLCEYTIKRNFYGKYILKNITKSNEHQIFDKLIFHGGEGFTLEMRLFSQTSLIQEFQRAGFHKIRFYEEPFPDFGIFFREKWSLPLSVRKA